MSVLPNQVNFNPNIMNSGVQLPTIDLLKFDGISLSQRFNYLRLPLKGEALDLLKNLEISPENYNIAWQLLHDDYDNNTVLQF
nr:unnamed protein product [Callosobruchus analis]